MAHQSPIGNYIAGHYRYTRMGGLTLPIGIKRAGSAVVIVKPVSRYHSKLGSHGIYYFPPDIDALIHLHSSNSGHRSVHIRCFANANFCNALKRCVHELWIVRKASPRDVLAALQSCRL